MKITYLGHSCFCIENTAGVKIITDPYTRVGYELPKNLTADIVTVSHGHFDHNYTPAIGGAPKILSSEGECEVCGVKITATHTWHDPKQGALRGSNLIFKFEIDGVKICHFGDLGEGYSEKIAKILSDSDIWLIPVGGTYTIDAIEAKEYMDKLAPKAVVPMHYRPQDGALDITPIGVFLQKIDENSVIERPLGEWSVEKTELENGKTKVIYMERKK